MPCQDEAIRLGDLFLPTAASPQRRHSIAEPCSLKRGAVVVQRLRREPGAQLPACFRSARLRCNEPAPQALSNMNPSSPLGKHGSTLSLAGNHRHGQ